jgi:penicillin G amidase
MEALILVSSIVFIAGLTVAGFVFYLYWWQIQRPVPDLDGDRDMVSLEAPVQVLRDRYGVPHIYASGDADLFKVQGYVHAQDRLWQMEQSRRIAHGRLAEVFGEAALDADRFSRLVGFTRAAQRELAQLDETERRALEWYAEGVNEFIRQNPGKLAAECNLLRFQPELWTELDTLACMKLMAWESSVNWETELLRLLLVGEIGAEGVAELEPGIVQEYPVITQKLAKSEAMELLSITQRILSSYEAIKPWLRIRDGGSGSNSWAIAPKRSVTRRAILANDTHQGARIPVQWYELHLSSPTLHVSGASLPGVPGVFIGHNESIAWGLTSAPCDVQDLYLERSRPDNRDQYELGGQWYAAEVLEESIRVRGRNSPHVERIRVSRHGPIVDAVIRDCFLQQIPDMAFSLRWAGQDPGDTLKSLLLLNRATDWESFTEALAHWSTPTQSFTYADTDGNIGYLLAGRIPRRAKGHGLMPSPGWDVRYDWNGYASASDLPRIFNPESGYIVTANNRISAVDIPVFMGEDFSPGWRAGRLEDLLLEKERCTLRDVEEMQLDTGSWFARRLAPWFGRLEPRDSYEKLAAELLREWDHKLASDSSGASVFHFAWRALMRLVYVDKVGQAESTIFGAGLTPLFLNHSLWLRASERLLELITDCKESAWYRDAATGRERNRNEILAEALAEAVAQLRATLGDNARRWEWGRVHQIRFNHPLGSARLLGTFLNCGPFPIGGDFSTPLQTGESPNLPPQLVQVIPTYRQIFDVGNWDSAETVIATGQSGRPFSTHYTDQVDMWREGEYRTMPWSREAVESAAMYRMLLWPAGKRL